MTVKLTYDLLARMFRCPDCRPEVPIGLTLIPHDVQRIVVNHALSCPNVEHSATLTKYMPIEVEDNDPVLIRLEGGL